MYSKMYSGAEIVRLGSGFTSVYIYIYIIMTRTSPRRLMAHVTRMSHVTCDTSLGIFHITETRTANISVGQTKVRSGQERSKTGFYCF